ncbi:MAG: hypothetical protein HC796_00710 [Synechococcaceae cyanobacterium RL_1_2]|nr:hypothetical protein [Synechococcaceae cyanobacterium RL_1_2]
MRVAKDVTIFEADGVTPAGGGVGNATDNVVSLTGGTPTTPNPTYNPKPTDILEYTVTYRNISETQTGNSLNVVLSATDFIITEDGTTGTPNNWAVDNDDLDGDADATSGIDTSNVIGSANGVFTDGVTSTTVTFAPGGDQTGTDQAGDVTVYTNDTTAAGTITPQTEGTFTFRRVVN